MATRVRQRPGMITGGEVYGGWPKAPAGLRAAQSFPSFFFPLHDVNEVYQIHSILVERLGLRVLHKNAQLFPHPPYFVWYFHLVLTRRMLPNTALALLILVFAYSSSTTAAYARCCCC